VAGVGDEEVDGAGVEEEAVFGVEVGEGGGGGGEGDGAGDVWGCGVGVSWLSAGWSRWFGGD